MSNNQRYSTIRDVIRYAVEPVLGDFVDDFNTEAIANELFEFVTNVDENGVQHGNGYFIEREGMDWEDVMQRHDHGEELNKIAADAWHGFGTYAFAKSNERVENIKCNSEKDLKYELHEFFQCYDYWNDKVVVTKISDL